MAVEKKEKSTIEVFGFERIGYDFKLIRYKIKKEDAQIVSTEEFGAAITEAVYKAQKFITELLVALSQKK